jgi:hypothetical protein
MCFFNIPVCQNCAQISALKPRERLVIIVKLLNGIDWQYLLLASCYGGVLLLGIWVKGVCLSVSWATDTRM